MNAVKFEVAPVKRPMLPGVSSNTGISFEFPGADGLASEPVPAGQGAVYNFPISERARTVRVIVRNPDECPEPLEYALTIIRHGQVLAAPGKEDNFIVSGASDHCFSRDEQVFFDVLPPFGYTVSPGSVTASSGGAKLPLVSTGGGYVFTMPLDMVALDAAWDPVPAAADVNVRYVYEKGTGDGSTWANATNDLQSLIDAFDSVDDNYEIWIAAGKIRPVWAWADKPKAEWPSWASGLSADQLTNDNKCFVLKNGIRIYGGFSGRGTEKSVADRENRPYKNIRNGTAVQTMSQTILSGKQDNTRHLMLALNITKPTLVEGLHIAESKSGGQTVSLAIDGISVSTSYGAGLYVIKCTRDLVFSHVTFRDDYAGRGAGAYVNTASPSFRDCSFRDNTAASSGAGIFINSGSAPFFERCNFQNNYCAYGAGAAMRADSANTAPVLKDCNFIYNHGYGIWVNGSIYMEGGEVAGNDGNGINIYKDSAKNAVLTNVRITNNYGISPGMGVSFTGDSDSVLAMTNVEISGGKGYRNGGVAIFSTSKVLLTNVTIAGNEATEPDRPWISRSGGILFDAPPAPGSMIANSIIYGNKINGGIINIDDTRPAFSNSIAGGIIEEGVVDSDPLFAASYRLKADSPAVDAGDNGLYNNVHSALACAENIVISANGTATIPAAGSLPLRPGPAFDLAGKQRIKGANIDMGAYEY
jgi:hypothetical protein